MTETDMDTKSLPPKILVVDDEEGFRELVIFEFTSLGYRVISAADGEEAVRVVRAEGDVDVVVSDVTMPRLNGLDAMREIKKLDPKIEVIMITGCATIETAVESMRRGAYDYITKPFQIADLARLVVRALEKRRLSRTVDELKEINKFKSEFLANMSHELRTPMNAILGYTSLHLDRLYGEITPKQEEALKRVDASGKNLLQLINGILDLSKITAGRMPVFLEEFSLKDLADEIVTMMESLTRPKGLELATDIPADLRLYSDRTKVKQIFVNLVSNGIKFTDKGGVYISAVRRPDGGLDIRVKDTGIGIKTRDLPQLFQEFRQLDPSATREYSGTGLGLVISRKFARLLGGDVSAESVFGAGSTFTVTLPAEAHRTGAPSLTICQPAENAGRKTVLAIDDDPEVLTLLRDSLLGSGYGFIGAPGAEEGVALAREHKPFAITLDIMMPKRDGWSVLQTIKSDPQLKDIPVIVLSITDNKTLGYALGVTDYMTKPFERAELLRKLAAIEAGPTADAPLTVLVAEAQRDTAAYLETTLAAEGYKVETVSDGGAVLARIEAVRPDILFLDPLLQGGPGFEVVDAVHRDPALAHMKVFVLTGRHLTDEENDYLSARTEAVIQKGSRSLPEILELVKKKLESLETINGR